MAAHSGTNYNAYFNNLVNLKLNDKINIYLNNKSLIYQINKIYYIEKTGYLTIDNNLINNLILITCSKTNHKKQLIIKANLINIINN